MKVSHHEIHDAEVIMLSYQSSLWMEQMHYSLLWSGLKLKGGCVWGGYTPEVKSGGGVTPEVKRNVIDRAIVCNTQGKEQDLW
jgi:hypothetical protein